MKFVSDLREAVGFLGILVSSTKKADRRDITEILLKVALNTINDQTKTKVVIRNRKSKKQNTMAE